MRRDAHLRALLAAVLLLAGQADAVTPLRLDVSIADGVYRVGFEALLDAPVDAVAAVLTDYVGYVSLDPRIRESEVVGTTAEGEQLVRTRIRACAGFFCRDVRRVERVTYQDGVLLAEALPGDSDVVGSVARTEWQAVGDGTRIVYEAEFSPDFWVPKVVARYYAERMLRDSVVQLFENVEARARER